MSDIIKFPIPVLLAKDPFQGWDLLVMPTLPGGKNPYEVAVIGMTGIAYFSDYRIFKYCRIPNDDELGLVEELQRKATQVFSTHQWVIWVNAITHEDLMIWKEERKLVLNKILQNLKE